MKGECVMAKEEVTFRASATAVEEAEMEAVDPGLEKQADEIIAAWEDKLSKFSDKYVAGAMKEHMKGPGEGQEIAGPFGPVWPLYPWWNLILAGPFQRLGGAGGAFLPHKVIRWDDDTFMLGVVWRNPACINWACPAPSACEIMSGWTARVWLRTCNLTRCVAGPGFRITPDIVFPAYPTCRNFFRRFIRFPAPPQGAPDLYEMNATVDITGPGVVSFAGYSTWVFDPDWDPFPPMPPVGPHWQYDHPVRMLVYTP
jgi:hypothetical protein